MSFDLVRIIGEMDWMARGVCLALLCMGLASLTVFIERSIAFWRSARQSRRMAVEAQEYFEQRDLGGLMRAAAQYQHSHLATLLQHGLRVFLSSKLPSRDAVELVKRELVRRQEEAGIELRRGLSTIASVGSVAPFVGLLGTVLGIIAAFSRISATGSGGLSSVAGGISEALVVTALGLLIAIPAVLLFNRLSTQADSLHQRLATAASQLVDHLEFSGESVRKVQDSAA